MQTSYYQWVLDVFLLFKTFYILFIIFKMLKKKIYWYVINKKKAQSLKLFIIGWVKTMSLRDKELYGVAEILIDAKNSLFYKQTCFLRC